MKPQRFMVFVSIATVLAVQASSAPAQQNAVTSVNWPLHNLDLAGSRFSAMDPDQHVEREVTGPAMAVPARRHRRRQQSDDPGHRRRA